MDNIISIESIKSFDLIRYSIIRMWDITHEVTFFIFNSSMIKFQFEKLQEALSKKLLSWIINKIYIQLNRISQIDLTW